MPAADGAMRPLHVPADKFEASVHGKLLVCVDCHQDIKEIPHNTSTPHKVDCGNCHAQQKEQYLGSVHGRASTAGNSAAAVCASCHTKHEIASTKDDATQLAIVQKCGSCHAERLKSYVDTYHGKVNTLGYTYTAKCFDCHGNHGIQRVSDPASTLHPSHRLQTCQKCHTEATAGFLTFEPHANTHDFHRYPYMWVTSKFMLALLAGVFAFFWIHTALWFYREYRARKHGEKVPHVTREALPATAEKQVRRFPVGWRIAHLAFALCVMTLVLTGMTVFYAETMWAKVVVNAFGGPRIAGLVHRIAAATMLSIFFVHLIYMALHLGPKGKSFKWFGPDSLVPNLQDLRDIVGMFKWFIGKGPRPLFDRWTYWEKFDYWAVFWGMGIIGVSGSLLAFKYAAASILPGWVFNVATLVHGEEAFLAAVFLFTVHFFNNHFRPYKYPPPDIVMFTGSVPVEEFRHEHPAQYHRLVESGELSKYLVDAPSRPMTVGSRLLGIVLLFCGLMLLAGVVAGFIRDMNAG